MGKCKFCMDFREKLKHVLWMGDLNASYINSAAIKRHLMCPKCVCLGKSLMVNFLSSSEKKKLHIRYILVIIIPKIVSFNLRWFGSRVDIRQFEIMNIISAKCIWKCEEVWFHFSFFLSIYIEGKFCISYNL